MSLLATFGNSKPSTTPTAQVTQTSAQNAPANAPATVKVSTFAITVTVLGIFLIIALYFLGSVTLGSCNKTCSSSKVPQCPIGYVAKCDPCSGTHYCAEQKCTTNADCTKSQTRSNKENRSQCVLPSGETQGYCYQCKDDDDTSSCAKPMKCHRGWCSLCVNDSDCTTSIYDAPANGKCKNNVCVFTSCNTGKESSAKELSGNTWPYNTDAYNTDAYKTCALKT